MTSPTITFVITATETSSIPITPTESGTAQKVTIDCSPPFDEVLKPGTVIISPNYPNPYNNKLDCQMTIRFSHSPTVLIEFDPIYEIEGIDSTYKNEEIDFDVNDAMIEDEESYWSEPRNHARYEESPLDLGFDMRDDDYDMSENDPCRYDYLEARDGPSADSPRIGSKLCGGNAPAPIQSTGNSMTLVFHTDGTSTKTGFKITANSGKYQIFECSNSARESV